jgi:TP901 family phage tail tape measure protein
MAKLRLDLQLTGFDRASGKLKQFGNKMKSVGASMQRFSLPLAIAGGAAIKMAADFNRSMTKIQALVGVVGDDFDELKVKVKEFAKETATSSTEAADAMFYITSAGLRGADAIDTLNISLKAAAAGLGNTETIARLNTAAMAAYGKENLTTAQATDVLVSAVKEGRLDAEQLAESMESVVSVSATMGVEFNELAAAFAAVSKTNSNASIAATGLRGILTTLLNPTTQARDVLNGLGLSADTVRQKIKDDGLLSTLKLLTERFAGNADATATVFGNVKALVPVLALTGASAGEVDKLFERMNNTQGETQKAFDITASKAEFKLKKAMNDAKEAFKDIGDVLLVSLLPAFQNLSKIIVTVFKAFTNLDTVTQNFIIGAGLLVVALPTLITLFGSLATIIAGLLSPAALVAAALVAIAMAIYKNWNEVAPVLVNFYNMFVDLYNQSVILRVVIFGLKAVFKSVFIYASTQIKKLSNNFATMWKLIKEFSEKKFKGDFAKILKDGFDKNKKISDEGGEEIAETFVDGFGNALKSKLEHKTVDQLNAGITNIVDKAKGTITNLLGSMGLGSGGGSSSGGANSGGGSSSSGGGGDEDPIDKLNKKTEQTIGNFLKLGLTSQMVGDEISGAFMNAFSSMMEGENFFKSLIKGLVALIKKLVAAAIAAFVLSTILGGLNIGGIEKGAKGFKQIFSSLTGLGGNGGAGGSPKPMAVGGIVSSPTLGLMGEYPGARSNPEVVAPLDRLKSMIGNRGGSSNVQVSGQFALKGQDLVVALQRADRNRNRIK